ncbi:NAD(P)-dependent oxidoreductase [Chloroflexus sp.]|uniref:NAD(P)-dependent oxidoreductase n=1 Tax=Chloroflexus sp. TaxID=1904827 RepID=UPI0039A5E002
MVAHHAHSNEEIAMTERIGFIGLGIMGRGMAANILRAGFPLTVWNRTPGRADELVAAGAQLAASPAEVAARSDIVISCVSDTPDVEAVLFGPQGAIEGARAGMLMIDMSTISPQGAQQFAARLGERGIGFLDAPVSGGSEGAARGTLSIMVGGPAELVERAMPVFQAMGKTITHVGGHGAGQTVKLVNQILVVGTMLAISEALVFAQASGVDLEKALAAVSGGAAGSWMLSNRGPQVIRRDWRPGFTIDLQQKDLRLVLAAADAVGAPMLVTSTVFHLYRTLQAAGLGHEGNHALIKAIERLAGIEVGTGTTNGGRINE